MTNEKNVHRLDGLEADNLLAFLALLGLLRSLEAADGQASEKARRLRPRAAWDFEQSPLRPLLVLSHPLAPAEVAGAAGRGLDLLAANHDFGEARDLNHSSAECREILRDAARQARAGERMRADLLAALMSDAAIKRDKKEEVVDPTPLCLLFGQGHQHFLERMAQVPREAAPPRRGKGKTAATLSAAQCLAEALFQPWLRSDPTQSFRWDPDEGVRYALRAGDPTDDAYKQRTQHGANRLAAVGLAALTLAPQTRGGRVRPSIVGGAFDAQGFSFAWPVLREPATLAAIAALLSHPQLRESGALAHLGVDRVFVARRVSVGKFMNIARARVGG